MGDFVITLQQKIPLGDGKVLFEDLPYEITDKNDGQYEVKHQADEGDVVAHVKLVDENGKPRPIRGFPFKPTFSNMARNKANEYTGPLVSSFITSSLKSLDEFYQTTNVGHSIKLKDGDVMNLIKVMNHIKDMYREEDALILRQDEIFETLAHNDKEGVPGDKH